MSRQPIPSHQVGQIRETGLFEDPRIRGLDGRPFGPLPREWSHYKGLYKYNDQVIIKYTVDKAIVYETHQIDTIDQGTHIQSNNQYFRK